MDILFCSAPGTFNLRPTLAPAVLKACATNAGFTAMALDLNIEIYNQIKQNPKQKLLEEFFQLQKIHKDIVDDIGNLLDYCVNRIIDLNPKILGLSLLTQDSQFFTVWLCYHLKTLRPDLKIVIGGSGIKNFIAESKINFAELLKTKGYINDYINGDGEYSIVEYLKDNLSYPGINSGVWQPIKDLNVLPYPDFSDYNFSQYKDKGIPICDSRGCVRTCEFCDIIEHWKKYQYRTAENIFDEMLYQIKQHNITRFFFYNSLTNGNMKEFQKLLDLMCNYNDNNPTAQISWDGYFIVRNKKQHPEDFWQKIKKSNGYLQLGIESVVEKVRVALGKNFTNDDIDYHLEMAKKYSVPLLLLLIVGYPTEVQQDFEFTKQWFRDRKKYARMPINQVIFSLSAILPNTKLERKQQEYGIVRGEIPTIWMTQATDISTQDRINYFNELNELLTTLNMAISNGGSSMEITSAELIA
jgi:Radical SAM superfamily